VHAIAQIELVVCWVAWAAAFLRAKRTSWRTDVIAPEANWGVLLQSLAYPLAWINWRRTGASALDPAGMVLAPLGVVLVWAALRHLGAQWRVQAALYSDHRLVPSGPYRIVRHPLYASMVALYLATAFVIANWVLAIPGLVLMIVGTEIRVRAEDRLLASRFGAEFERYRASVPAYVPFVR